MFHRSRAPLLVLFALAFAFCTRFTTAQEVNAVQQNPPGAEPSGVGSLSQGGPNLSTEDDVRRFLTDGISLPFPEIGPVHIYGIECTRQVSFSHLKFTGDAVFSVNFKADADFSDAEFQGDASFAFSQFTGANFQGASFRRSADFTGAQFALAYFWRTFFDGPVKFVQMQVRPAEGLSNGFLQPGEANFSYAKFAKRADFTRATFEGPVYLVSTRFGGPALFSEAKFRKSVLFQEGGENITIARGDFANIVNDRWAGPRSAQLAGLGKAERDQLASSDNLLFNRLLETGVLRGSGEQFANGNLPPGAVSYADFPAGQSESQWKTRLEQARLTPAQLALFDTLRKALAQPMFPPDSDCSFEYAEFPEQGQAVFRDTDLSRCRFLQSKLERAELTGVRWDRQTMLFGHRAALYDERQASDRAAFLELERLYNALQSKSEKDETASEQFHFGAMEMARRAGSRWLAFSKYLNGYNTSLLLPVIWLVIFLGGVFPLIYLRLGVASNYTNALLHSLYLSSLLKDETPVKSSTPGRLVQVAQTVVIGLLLTAASFVAKQKLGL